jgi:regulator of protease activity HflC (stomatin/prohibitin superfamily)
MATISSFLFLRHLRADPTDHVLHFKAGSLVRSGRGMTFWFLPLSASVAGVPCDDRDQSFLFRGRTADHQEATVQGVVTWRAADPERLAARVDFSLDLRTGHHTKTPLEQLSALLTQLAQQLASEYLQHAPLKQILRDGVERVREAVRVGLAEDPALAQLGVAVVSVRVAAVTPTAELEKALQATVREAIQQEADQAAFQRRALAVEKERAIQENELQNRIELAKRQEQLIAQEGQNALRKAREEAEASRVVAAAEAERSGVEATARAESIRAVQEAKVGAERARIDIYRDLPASVMAGLAARELAGKLERIEHVSIAPELLGPLLTDLVRNATQRLEGPKA